MELTFLGTSAANAYPEAFCSCSNCQRARAEGGRSLRKRSSALVNRDLLLDLGPDIMAAAQMHGIDLTGVRYCLQTHPHADHMDLSHLLSRSPGFGVVGAPRLHLYASPATLERADKTFKRDLSEHGLFDPGAKEELNLALHPIQPLQPVRVGPYRVTAYLANHAPGLGAYLYAIEHEGRSVFYGIDTAALTEDTWEALGQRRTPFDLVVLDHTYGPEEVGSDHLSARQLIEHARRMREGGLLKDDGRVFGTHIAHEGNPPHSELAAFASAHGYEIAYDGLTVTV
jgi:phosphoribosyl 1,2-cyclic phosphate phosphodiesterase